MEGQTNPLGLNPAGHDRVWLHRTCWLLLVLGVFRIAYTWLVPLDLVHDEAYYWDWSRRLAWGYYSKPPLVAWLIALSTSLGGSSTFFVRLPSVLLGTVGLAWMYLLAASLYGRRAGFWAVCLTAATPGNAAVSLLMTIDAPFLFCWGAALFSFWRLLQADCRRTWWLLAAVVSVGLGLLSKQTMLGFLVLGGFFIATSRDDRRELLKPAVWLWVVGSLAFLTPVLWWNSQHGWITAQHTSQHFAGESVSVLKRLARCGEFVGSQFGVLSPLTCFLVLAVIVAALKSFLRLRRRERFLLCFSGLPLAGVFVLSAVQRVEPNWPASFYLAGVVLLVGVALGHVGLAAPSKIGEKSLLQAVVVGAVAVALTYLQSEAERKQIRQSGGHRADSHRLQQRLFPDFAGSGESDVPQGHAHQQHDARQIKRRRPVGFDALHSAEHEDAGQRQAAEADQKSFAASQAEEALQRHNDDGQHEKTRERGKNPELGPNELAAAGQALQHTHRLASEMLARVLSRNPAVLAVPPQHGRQKRQRSGHPEPDSRLQQFAPIVAAGHDEEATEDQETEHGLFGQQTESDRNDGGQQPPRPAAIGLEQPPEAEERRSPAEQERGVDRHQEADGRVSGRRRGQADGPEARPAAVETRRQQVHPRQTDRAQQDGRQANEKGRRSAQRRGQGDQPGHHRRFAVVAPGEPPRPIPVVGLVVDEVERHQPGVADAEDSQHQQQPAGPVEPDSVVAGGFRPSGFVCPSMTFSTSLSRCSLREQNESLRGAKDDYRQVSRRNAAWTSTSARHPRSAALHLPARRIPAEKHLGERDSRRS